MRLILAFLLLGLVIESHGYPQYEEENSDNEDIQTDIETSLGAEVPDRARVIRDLQALVDETRPKEEYFFDQRPEALMDLMTSVGNDQADTPAATSAPALSSAQAAVSNERAAGLNQIVKKLDDVLAKLEAEGLSEQDIVKTTTISNEQKIRILTQEITTEKETLTNKTTEITTKITVRKDILLLIQKVLCELFPCQAECNPPPGCGATTAAAAATTAAAAATTAHVATAHAAVTTAHVAATTAHVAHSTAAQTSHKPASSTAHPTAAPSTAHPTAAPSTAHPTAAPSTAHPTAAPSTAHPTAAPTTAHPTAAPSTAHPTAAPGTVAPSPVAPVVATTAASPSLATTVEATVHDATTANPPFPSTPAYVAPKEPLAASLPPLRLRPFIIPPETRCKPGLSEECAYPSCAAIKKSSFCAMSNTTCADGVYWIDPNMKEVIDSKPAVTKSSAMKVFCDMTEDGGGWTLLLSLAAKDIAPATLSLWSNDFDTQNGDVQKTGMWKGSLANFDSVREEVGSGRITTFGKGLTTAQMEQIRLQYAWQERDQTMKGANCKTRPSCRLDYRNWDNEPEIAGCCATVGLADGAADPGFALDPREAGWGLNVRKFRCYGAAGKQVTNAPRTGSSPCSDEYLPNGKSWARVYFR